MGKIIQAENAQMFKDFHILDIYGPMRELCLKIESRLGIITSRTMREKGLSREVVDEAQKIFSLKANIDIKTCEKEDFNAVYKDWIKNIHPDVASRTEKDTVHLEAVNANRDIVYTLR